MMTNSAWHTNVSSSFQDLEVDGIRREDQDLVEHLIDLKECRRELLSLATCRRLLVSQDVLQHLAALHFYVQKIRNHPFEQSQDSTLHK